jgi:hypothetical protein
MPFFTGSLGEEGAGIVSVIGSLGERTVNRTGEAGRGGADVQAEKKISAAAAAEARANVAA